MNITPETIAWLRKPALRVALGHPDRIQRVLRRLELVHRARPSFCEGVYWSDVQRHLLAIVDADRRHPEIISTQNPLVFDYLPIESAVQARELFVLCRQDNSRTWTAAEQRVMSDTLVRQMTEDEAEAFWSAYAVGIQPVSEVLRTQGLW